jgi:hypothetical protein
MTEAGVTSKPTSEYTPTVRMRSNSSATMPAAAIFHVRKYNEITIETSSRKRNRPWIALRETSWPQLAPTNDDVIEASSTP